MRKLYTSWLDEVHDITSPSILEYAKRNYADLNVINESSYPDNRHWVLFDAMKKSIADGGPEDQDFVWLDSDMIIDNEYAPDIWALDGSAMWVVKHDNPRHDYRGWSERCANFGILNHNPYPVTAIVKWRRGHALKVMEYIPKMCNKYGQDFKALTDEEALAVCCNHSLLGYRHIPQFWHAMSALYKKEGTGCTASFLHAAGRGKLEKLMAAKFLIENRI